MNDAKRTLESQRKRALGDSFRVLRVTDAAADYRIDVHDEVRELGQVLQLLVENFQALERNVIRLDVVDADLKMIEARFIQRLDFLGREKVSVGDHAGDHSVMSNASDDLFDLRMKQGLASADRDDRGS